MHLEEEVARAFPGWATRSAAFLRRVASDATTGSSGTVGGPSRTHFRHRLTCCLKWRQPSDSSGDRAIPRHSANAGSFRRSRGAAHVGVPPKLSCGAYGANLRAGGGSPSTLISCTATCALKIFSRFVLCPYAPLSFSDVYSSIHCLAAGGNPGDCNILLIMQPDTPEAL